MALVIEDGTIVSGANSYATVAGLTAYLSERGQFLGGSNGTSEQVLLLAMDYLETLDFIGTKYTKDQPLQWPRSGVSIDGFSYETTEIPNQLLESQYEVAIAIDSGNNPLASLDRTTKREKVGDIEVEYADDAKDATELVAVKSKLDKLISGGTGGNVVLLSRA